MFVNFSDELPRYYCIPRVIFNLFTALPHQCKLYYLLSYIISDITRKEATRDGEREASTGRGKKTKMEQHREWLLNFGFVPIFHFLVSRSQLLETSRSEGCDECQNVAVFVSKISVT